MPVNIGQGDTVLGLDEEDLTQKLWLDTSSCVSNYNVQFSFHHNERLKDNDSQSIKFTSLRYK